jgi:ABC-type transport system substrate-binding protein
VAVDYLQPTWKVPPFDTQEARSALDAATDRTTLAETVYHGAVRPSYHYIVDGLPGYNPALSTSWGAMGDAALHVALHADLDAARRHRQA